MNPKALVVILFAVTFTISFVIYLVVVHIITPHIDLSSTAKSNIEIGPELDESMFDRMVIKRVLPFQGAGKCFY